MSCAIFQHSSFKRKTNLFQIEPKVNFPTLTKRLQKLLSEQFVNASNVPSLQTSPISTKLSKAHWLVDPAVATTMKGNNPFSMSSSIAFPKVTPLIESFSFARSCAAMLPAKACSNFCSKMFQEVQWLVQISRAWSFQAFKLYPKWSRSWKHIQQRPLHFGWIILPFPSYTIFFKVLTSVSSTQDMFELWTIHLSFSACEQTFYSTLNYSQTIKNTDWLNLLFPHGKRSRH